MKVFELIAASFSPAQASDKGQMIQHDYYIVATNSALEAFAKIADYQIVAEAAEVWWLELDTSNVISAPGAATQARITLQDHQSWAHLQDRKARHGDPKRWTRIHAGENPIPLWPVAA